MPTVVMTTTLLPETHYSVFLLKSLKVDSSQWAIKTYADKRAENKAVDLDHIELVWSRTPFFLFQILFKALRDKPDIVHLQHELNMYGGKKNAWLFPILVMALNLCKLRTVVTVHAVVPKTQLTARYIRDFLGSLGKLPLAVFWTRLALDWIFGNICRFADCVIVHTVSLGRTLIHDYGCSSKKIAVIPLGVPDAPIAVGVNSNINAEWFPKIVGQNFILSFGYMSRRKGIENLINAYAGLNPKNRPLLVLAGRMRDPQYQDELQGLVRGLGIEGSVIFTSFVTAGQIDWLYSHSLFVVLPYRYSFSDSFPLAFASFYARPVIAPATGTFLDQLSNGVDALLYPPDDLPDLRSSMQLLLDNEGLRQRLANELLRRGRLRTWPRVGEETVQLYDRLLRNSCS